MLTAHLSPEVAARQAEYEAHRHRRLLDRARVLRLQADPDYCRLDGCVVWSPTTPGRCEVVTRSDCSCREFRLWGHCPHHAMVTELARKGGAA